MFDQLLESGDGRRRRNPCSLAISIGIHLLLVGGLLAAPLMYYKTLPDQEILAYIRIPEIPPPPPPPPPPPKPEKPQQTLEMAPRVALSELFVPPDELLPVPDETLAHFTGELYEGPSVPGHLGAQTEGWGAPIGIGQSAATPAPPAPKPVQEVTEPVPVSSVLERSRRRFQPKPIYPPLAVKIRLAGTVVLRALIDKEGNVTDLKVISGHRLLNRSAINAVSRWKYSPTVLNGRKVPVVTTITVSFKLRR